MKLDFTVPIIGDGQTEGDEYRPDVSGVVHPTTGAAPIDWVVRSPIGVPGALAGDPCTISVTFAD